MAYRRSYTKAFRPSRFSDDLANSRMGDMTRQENIERYARLVSEGLRLFEEGFSDITGEEWGDMDEAQTEDVTENEAVLNS